MYVKSVRRWVVPFLTKLEAEQTGSYERLLSELLITSAKTDLNPCRLVFEASKSHVSSATSPALNENEMFTTSLHFR